MKVAAVNGNKTSPKSPTKTINKRVQGASKSEDEPKTATKKAVDSTPKSDRRKSSPILHLANPEASDT